MLGVVAALYNKFVFKAFNQINRYQRESFWSGCGLFEFVQIFVISNGTYTKYYSNTTRFTHIKELSDKPTHKGLFLYPCYHTQY